MPDGTLTDDIWWAAQSSDVRKLRHMGYWDPAKTSLIHQLLLQGVLLDGPVVVMGYSPTWQMNYLKENGYAWFPAAGYPQLQGAPSIVPQGPMPPWGIKVSTNADDYPSYAG